MSAIQIEIKENTSVATIKLPNDDNTYSTKFISIGELSQLLDQTKFELNAKKIYKKKNTKIVYNTELLPANNGTSIVQVAEKDNGNRLIVLKKNKYMHDYVYHKSTISNVGIPTLLFFLSINKNNIIYSAKLFAIKGTVVTDNTKLCYYPFTNVSNYGEVCFGSNQDSLHLKNFTSLASFVDKFLMMPSRNHGTNKNELGIEVRQFLEVLSGMEFEDEFLTPTSKKYSDVVKEILNIKGED